MMVYLVITLHVFEYCVLYTKYILVPTQIKFYFSSWFLEISEDEAEDRLQDAIQEKFAVFGDVCVLRLKNDYLYILRLVIQDMTNLGLYLTSCASLFCCRFLVFLFMI